MATRTSGSPLSAYFLVPARLAAVVALAVSLAPTAHAQSTGTTATEELQEVVVSARRGPQALGVVTEQNALKSRISVTGDFLQTQAAGQSYIQSLNQIPGVNFTNNDPYGTSGGNLRIRGFDGSRVSVTLDGIPLNDTGNYALFTNQLIDPEVIDQADVNLGTTDVDSPTASATGGTVSSRTRRPSKDPGVTATLSTGSWGYRRVFGMFDTGEFGPLKTSAFVAASYQSYDKFRGPGDLQKKQINARVYQDLGSGNFVSLAFHFNRNRNAFYRTASEATFTQFGLRYDNIASCFRDLPTAGVADNDGATPFATTPSLLAADNPLNPSACSNFFGLRVNPSDTGNIRLSSLFHLGDKLRLTVDPSFQYTLANGGGSTTVRESPAATDADRRVVGATALAGFDLNGDGDILDTVRFYTPNNTNTRRYGVTTSLIWDVSDDHRVRFAYTLDYGKHRQTAEWGYLDSDSYPENVFAGRRGRKVPTADGSFLRGRDRYSIAELSQLAVEYRGEFLDNRLTATVGLRAPDFTRKLNQYCYSQNGGNGNSGQLLCTTQSPVRTLANGNVVFTNAANAVEYIPPYKATLKFSDTLPNVGLSYKLFDSQTLYLSYAEGLSAPRTDNLYAVRRQTDGSIGRAIPDPETTKAYDLGWRYQSPTVLASVAIWKVDYKNRIVAAFDPDLGFSVDRNLGDVKIQGFDLQGGWRPVEGLTVSGSASYNDSELLSDTPGTASGSAAIATKGKTLVETPKWTFGVRADFQFGESFRVGVQAKQVSDRYGSDLNDYIAPGYTATDLDAQYDMEVAGFRSAQLQLNVINLFNKDYFGSISSSTGGTSVPFYQIGAPRTVMASVAPASVACRKMVSPRCSASCTWPLTALSAAGGSLLASMCSGRAPSVTLAPTGSEVASAATCTTVPSCSLTVASVVVADTSSPAMKFIFGLPMKPATNWFTGVWYSSIGVPTCSIAPLFSTTMRLASVIASTWSWVT